MNSIQLLSLKGDLQLETDCPSMDYRATQFLLHQACESFLSNDSPEICQIFGRRVDILSEDASGMYTVFTKQSIVITFFHFYLLFKHV